MRKSALFWFRFYLNAVVFVGSWLNDVRVKEKLTSTNTDDQLTRYPREVKRLMTLPSDYSELINDVSRFTCPNSKGDESRAPTLCLVCGETLCSRSYCCQTVLPGRDEPVGAASAHAHTHGAGTGLFLM